MNNNMEKRNIPLPKGGFLEVEFDYKFLVAIAKHFGLKGPSAVNNDHIRMFVHGTTDNALKKVERNNRLAQTG